MEISTKLIFTIIFHFGFYIRPSFSQGVCQSYTYINVPGAQPSSATNVTSTDCRGTCYSTPQCSGFTMQGSYCLLNTGDPNNINYNSSASYSVFLPSSCDQAQTCYNTWTGTQNFHGSGGNLNSSITTINSCLMACQSDTTCTGVDWDTIKHQCFSFNGVGYATTFSNGVYHFDKSCSNLSSSASTRSSGTTLPVSFSSSTTPVTSSGTSLPLTPTRSNSPSSITLLPTSSSVSPPSSLTQSQTTPLAATSLPSSSTPSPCGVKCSEDKVCDGTSRQCVCITSCSNDNSPVCGSDNGTYENACLLMMLNCVYGWNTTVIYPWACGTENQTQDEESDWYPLAIKPAYIVLAGLGGGCLLLVLTAVILLCEYPMNGAETYSTNGTLVKSNGTQETPEQINMDTEGGVGGGDGGGGGDNVEFNPYYNRSEIDAPDFTKEENLM